MSDPGPRGPVLCLGDAIVALVCERAVAVLSEASSFVPRFGGAVGNVAVVAARCGAAVALAGGAGDDDWGRWLRDRLAREGVDVSAFSLLPDASTPVAFVSVDGGGEPRCARYGPSESFIVGALGERVSSAVADSGALFMGSDTLIGAEERALSMEARATALDAGLPVVFDPGLRLDRWRSQADAAASANACVPGALLVRCSDSEAALMTGEEDVERAALALVKAGARLVVVTLGVEGAMLRGELRADVDGVPAQPVSTVGVGDVFTGVLLARLALSDFYPPAVAAALREAVAASARASERWGAVD